MLLCVGVLYSCVVMRVLVQVGASEMGTQYEPENAQEGIRLGYVRLNY
jgi:hypothetical protein